MDYSVENFKEAYKAFGLPAKERKDYPGAEKFSQQFKKCSVLKYSSISYSSDTVKSNGHSFSEI